MLARIRDPLNVGVIKLSLCAPFLQQLNQFKSRTFANILNVLLVGNAHNVDPGIAQSAPRALVEDGGERINRIARDRRVDLTSKLNETGGNFVFAGFPGQIKRVNRDAMTAESSTRIERHDGLDLAASMTSKTSMPIASHQWTVI